MVAIAADTISRNFNILKDSAAETAFNQALADDYASTETLYISRPRDAMLNSRAEVLGKYKFTASALAQLCTRLASGASQLVSDVAGLRTTRPDNEIDVGLGIRVVNDLIRLRYDSVDGYGLVVDHSRNTIEGLVGRKYEYFPNKELFDRVNLFLDESGIATSFCEAALSGRRMLLRYRNDDPLFEVPHVKRTDEPFFGGFHFDNSEVGDCSVRAATMIIRQWCDNKAISSFLEGGKISHVRGKGFEKRVQRLFERVQKKAHEATLLKDNVVSLMDQSLGLGGTESLHDLQIDKLTKKLHRQGLTKEFVRTILDRTMSFGSYRSDAVKQGRSPFEMYASRTAYDLFNAITHEAKGRPIDVREHAEQLGYRMLLKQFEIT